MKQYVIYKITNPLGQVYIGQTYDYPKRMTDYSKLRCRSQRLLYFSFKTFGFDQHTLGILKNSTLQNANQDEKDLIKKYNSYNTIGGLNLAPGGKCIDYKDHEMPDLVKEQIRKTLTGRIRTQKERENIAKSKMGKSVKRETVEKSAKGRYKPVLQYSLTGEFIKEWVSATVASTSLDIRRNTIFTCCKFKSNHAGGYIWRTKIGSYPMTITPPKSNRVYRNTIKSYS